MQAIHNAMTNTPPCGPFSTTHALTVQPELLQTGLLEVRITTRHEAEAEALARLLVSRRFAAGVNCVPGVRSVYRWQGEMCEHSECLVLAQTTTARFAALEQAVRAAHSYQTPMITAVPLTMSSSDFALWVYEQTTP